MFSTLPGKITARFQAPAAAPPGRATLVLLMTVLLFAVANAYRHPPALVAGLDESTAKAVQNSRYVDDLFTKYTTWPAPGNLLLRFKGYDYSHDVLQPASTFEYIRASYAVYPKRVYVADDATLIPQAATGDPFPAFDPAPAWLDAHHVTGLIIVEQTADGGTRYYLVPRTKP